MVEISIPSVYSDKNNQILRLRASDVAAIAGYNPHANQLKLFMNICTKIWAICSYLMLRMWVWL